MNQRAYVELEIIKNEFPFKMFLPAGAQWADAHATAIEFADKIKEIIDNQAKAQEEAEAAKLAESAAQPIEVETEPISE